MCPALPSCRLVEVKEHVAIGLRRTCGGSPQERIDILRTPQTAKRAHFVVVYLISLRDPPRAFFLTIHRMLFPCGKYA